MTPREQAVDVVAKAARDRGAQILIPDHGCDGTESSCLDTCPVQRELSAEEFADHLITALESEGLLATELERHPVHIIDGINDDRLVSRRVTPLTEVEG